MGRGCLSGNAPELRAPNGLSIDVFRVGDDEYALLSHDLPLDGRLRPLTGVLTCAERAVAEALLRGESAGAIATARRSSPSTVRNQIRSIYAKLGVSGRAELGWRVALALRGERS